MRLLVPLGREEEEEEEKKSPFAGVPVCVSTVCQGKDKRELKGWRVGAPLA